MNERPVYAPLLTLASFTLLATFGLYVTVTTPRLDHWPFVRHGLIGLVFGITGGTATLMLADPSFEGMDTGMLAVAGFLGGPLGAILAAASSIALQLGFSGQMEALHCISVAASGAALGWALYGKSAVTFTPRSLVFLLLTATLASSLALVASEGLAAAEEQIFSWVVLSLASSAISALTATRAMMTSRNTRALKDFRERFDLASSVAQIGMWDWHVSADHCIWDSGMHALYGTDPSKPVKIESFIGMVVPEDRARVHRIKELMEVGGAPQQNEFRIRRTDGTLRVIRSTLRNSYGADGRLTRICGMHMDITELRHAEQERGVAKDQLSSVIASVPGAVLTWQSFRDGTSKLTYLNAQCEELFELDQASVDRDNRQVWHLIDAEDRRGLQLAIMQAVRTMTPLVHRFRMNTLSGKTIWIEGRAAPRRTPDGGLEASILAFDVTHPVKTQTELTEQKERAARAQRLESIGKLSGGIAHDFNNLLAIIVGNLEILREELSGKPDQMEYIHAGLDASARGADLVRSMLSFARKARLDPTEQPVAHLLERVDGWVARVLPATVEVSMDVDAQAWPIRADSSGTENALLNLILNARDAMPNGGKLQISAQNLVVPKAHKTIQRRSKTLREDLAPGNYVAISVKDTGHGVDPAIQSQVFEPFYTTRAPGGASGSGLGLSTVHGFMVQSGGAVAMTSTPGKGTTVTLFFAAAEGSIQTEVYPELPKVTATGQGSRILLAEDEPQVAKVMCRALELDGHSVTIAASGDEAAHLFEDQGPFEMLVTDIVMPGKLQGPDLAEKLRSQCPDLPVLFLSGYAPSTLADQGIRPGDLRLMKPVARASLAHAVAQTLASVTGPQKMQQQAQKKTRASKPLHISAT